MKKNVRIYVSVLIFSLFQSSLSISGGFLKVSGTQIVNENNENVLLRGIGIGGWHVPEGYMFGMSGFANAAWEIRNKIVEVVGPQNADIYYSAFRGNFVTRKDIERLAELGFNSVRMPMHFQFFVSQSQPDVWIESGFVVLDSLLKWCGDNNIYLILDLHAAPGGQSANNISDYNPAIPSLWESPENKSLTVALWKKLAERYANEPWIGGYDILNEPAWNLGDDNAPLRSLYIEITNAIRQHDTKHIIFVEGNWFATSFGGLTPPWDDNLVYSFHKYWNANDVGAINYLLTLRNTANRPLWLGESGENSNVWFTDCISLMEANNIGWAWWTLKKFDAIAGIYSVSRTAEYDALVSYWSGQGAKPTVTAAMKGLMDMAEGLKLNNCTFRPDVVDAMLRQPNDNTSRPFTENIVPGKVFAVNYDIGKNLIAYKDNDFQNTGSGAAWNNGWTYRNDGVDIEKCSDAASNGYNVGWTATGEFLTFTLTVSQDGKYNIAARFAAPNTGGSIGVSIDNGPITIVSVIATGGYQSWGTQSIGKYDLSAGTHILKTFFYFGGFNVNSFDFGYVGPMAVEDNPGNPVGFTLEQNFPNPFNPETTIRYSVQSTSHVSLKVYDILGSFIRTLVDKEQHSGNYSVRVDAATVPSGVYYYTLQAGSYSETKIMTVVK